MISKILALEALIGTIRAHLSVPVRNVSDITPEQHSHEIINAIGLLSDKGKQLAEARAEIERLKNEHENSLDKAKNYTLELSGATTKQAGELADKDRQLTEARAEIERLKAPDLDVFLLREKLSELAHNQWAGWMEYLFFKSKQVDGCVIIPAWANERWRRQVATRYADLPEAEKDSDRNEADKILAVFRAHIAERDKLIEQMREALTKCKAVFETYVTLHSDKLHVAAIMTEDECGSIREKIARNQAMVDICEAALSAAERERNDQD